MCLIRKMSQTSEFIGKKLVWVDCEMTGLDINTDRLLEVAVVVTNGNLDTVCHIICIFFILLINNLSFVLPIDPKVRQFGPFIIKTEKHILDSMNEWCVKTHTESGLVKQCLESELTIEEVDKRLSESMVQLNISKGLLAGNSVSK